MQNVSNEINKTIVAVKRRVSHECSIFFFISSNWKFSVDVTIKQRVKKSIRHIYLINLMECSAQI